MEIQLKQKGDIVIFYLKGRVDAATSSQVEEKINSAINVGTVKIIINCASVDYLSSSGLRLIISVSKKLESVSGKLVICNLQEEVLDIVKLAGLDLILNIAGSEVTALSII